LIIYKKFYFKTDGDRNNLRRTSERVDQWVHQMRVDCSRALFSKKSLKKINGVYFDG